MTKMKLWKKLWAEYVYYMLLFILLFFNCMSMCVGIYATSLYMYHF